MADRHPNDGGTQLETAELRERVPASFVRRASTVLGFALLGILVVTLVWLAIEVFLVIFAGALLGVFLLALRDFVARHSPLSEGWALATVVVTLIALLAGAVAVLVPQIAEQADEFREMVPEMVSRAEEFLLQYGWGQELLQQLDDGMAPEGGAAEGIVGVLGWLAGAATYLVAFLFIGLFVAINPRLYSDGLVHMMPRSRRARTREVIREVGETLRWFLVARAIAMIMVGASTAIVLFIFGIPLALLLGLIAALLTFIPYLGPVIAAVPILLVAMLEGPMPALYVLIAYTVIQQIEGNIFDPLILQKVVHLPPAVTVSSQILGGALLGPAGIALATPFAAVMQVVHKRVYREDVLGDQVDDEDE